MASNWTADNDSGSSGFDPADLNRVLSVLEDHRGRGNAISRQQLASDAHLGKAGRTLRSILRAIDLDPGLPLLCYDFQQGSVWLAASLREADSTTDWFEASGKEHLHRARARRDKAARAVAAQPLLFELPV